MSTELKEIDGLLKESEKSPVENDAQVIQGEGHESNLDYTKAFECDLKAAEQGDSYSQFLIGWAYHHGTRCVETNHKKAFDWYQKAAAQGEAYAHFCIGEMYRNGDGVEQDYKKAVEWYQKAAVLGFADAQFELGVAYDNGVVVEQDVKKALEWFKKSADQNNSRGLFATGAAYAIGRGVLRDDKESYAHFKKLADKKFSFNFSNNDAQFCLILAYHAGRATFEDSKTASEVYQNAADNCENFGYIWYRKYAEQGHHEAEFYLGIMYTIQKNIPEALKWYQKAAVHGHKDATKQIEKIAGQGVAEAQYILGQMYENGRGVQKSNEEASKWYRMATQLRHSEAKVKLLAMADGGIPEAQYHQGQFLEQQRRQVLRNDVFELYRKASEQGYKPAEEAVERMVEYEEEKEEIPRFKKS